jgi:hypothetical protein
MITKQECADWINGNITTELSADEIATLRSSIENHPLKPFILETLLTTLGDVSLLVEIRDAN